jgi:predicted transposase YbfD/YdcC
MEDSLQSKDKLLTVLIGKFAECDDYRDPDRLSYPLVEILYLTFCASVCGCESFQEIVDFGELKLSWLRKFLPYENGIPSHDTVNTILSVLNTKQLEKVLAGFCEYSIKLPGGTVINIDGKKIRRSATIKEQQTKKTEGGKQSIIMVNAFCSVFNSCLASVRVSSKSGEKNALEDILQFLDLSHCLLTFDAGYCYTDVTDRVILSQADYVIGLKENQPKLYALAGDLLSSSLDVEIHVDPQEDSHGRLEQRTCTVLNINTLDKDQLEQYDEVLSRWKGLNTLIKVICQRTVKSTGKTSAEARYYISSKELTPKEANKIVRGHWEVENNLHWVLDAIFGEDKGTKRTGNSAANFSIIRKLAFNKLKTFEDPKVSMKRKIKKCAISENYLENVLGIL